MDDYAADLSAIEAFEYAERASNYDAEAFGNTDEDID
jgi:hypothetical protein